MINSLLHLHKEVSNALKRTGHYGMCFGDDDMSLLQELQNYLQSFAQMTDLVNRRPTLLSLIPLNQSEIADACKMGVHDCD